MALELTTVADDGAVFFDGPRPIVLDALHADTAYRHEDIEFRTLARPDGQRLATVATVNDLHRGQVTGKAWSIVIDACAILLCLISFTGLILIFFLVKRRTAGLLLAAIGGIICLLAYRFLP